MQFHAYGDKNRKSILALHGMLHFHADEYLKAIRSGPEGQG